MGQIIVTKLDNSIITLGTVDPVTVITKAEQSITHMGDDRVEIEVISNEPLNLSIGDSIVVYGRKYTLLDIPAIDRNSHTQLLYNLSFSGGIGQLQKVYYKLDGNLGTSGSTNFQLMADLDRFITLLVSNMNVDYGPWKKGTIDESENRNLTFSNETCQSVLSRLAEEYAMEYYIDYVAGKWVINMSVKVGRDLPDVYKYGQGLGLLYIKRKFVSEDTFTTKLYAFGSDKNIPSNYRNYSPRLKMPAVLSDDVEAPTPPQNLLLTVIYGTQFQLTWDASTDNVAVTGYEVWVSEDGSAFSLSRTVSATHADFNYILGHGEMRYKVKAFDAAGNKSRASNIVNLYNNNIIDPPIITRLSESLGVLVEWGSPVSDIDQVEVWRKSGLIPWSLIATLNDNANSYNDIDVVLHPTKPTFYKMRSVRAGYYFSNYSNIKSLLLGQGSTDGGIIE